MEKDEKSKARDQYGYSHSEAMKYWRSWGSWFSWGSPVGLGLFFLAVGGFVWLLGQTFNWG